MKKRNENELIKLAEEYCMKYHEDQFRKNGAPYYKHPFAVRDLLKKYGYSDYVTQCVALLHDVFEDSEVMHHKITHELGHEVSNAVYVLSRNTISLKERDVILKIIETSISKIPKDTTPREIVEKLYKIRLTFATSLVLRVKIADMVDNTRDLESLSPEGRKRKIRDALDFYIPLGREIAPKMVKELEENVGKYL